MGDHRYRRCPARSKRTLGIVPINWSGHRMETLRRSECSHTTLYPPRPEPGRKRRLCVPWAFHSSDWHTLLVYFQHTSHIQYTHRGGRSLRPHLRLCFGHTTPYAHAAGPFGRVGKSPLVAILATSTVGKKAGPGLHRAHNAEVALLGGQNGSLLGFSLSLSLRRKREVRPVA